MTVPEQDALIGQRVLTPDLPRQEVALALQFTRDKFGAEWLEDGSAPHPLRDLWSRLDFIAAHELYTLGDSMLILEELDPTG